MSVDPVTIGLIVSSTMAVAQGVASHQARSAKAKQIERSNAMQRIELRRASVANYDALMANRDQERDKASQAIEENRREALKGRSRASAAAGEGHASGLSVNALLRDFHAAEGRFERATDRNYEGYTQQLDRQMDAVSRNEQTQLNSLPIPERPSFALTALRVGSSIAQAYTGYLKAQPNTGDAAAASQGGGITSQAPFSLHN